MKYFSMKSVKSEGINRSILGLTETQTSVSPGQVHCSESSTASQKAPAVHRALRLTKSKDSNNTK